AWDHSYRTPETAYALGRLYAALYARELEKIKVNDSEKSQAEAKKKLEKEYRIPALSYLQNAEDVEMESPLFVKALLAYLDRDYPQALNKARQAVQKFPWLYEASALSGETFASMANEKSMRGDTE